MERLGRTVRWPEKLYCTVEQTIHLKGARLDLMSLHEELLGAKFDNAHKADADVGALTRCLVEMYKRDMI